MISLNEMSALARALLDAESKTKDAEQALKDAKERERLIREETIPSAMQELGLESLVLDTGQKLKVQQEVYASIPAANKQAAYRWLNDNGFGGLIKVEVGVAFGKGDQENALDLFNKLTGLGLQASLDEGVHAQTLKAFLKEQISQGNDIPLDLFGARPVWAAKITNK